jgi:hypothetical protein
MWLRVAFIALLMVVMVTGSGTAEFTSPSLDQWGGGTERVLPQQQFAAGRHGNATWVAPSSLVVLSGAPVALHALPSTTVTTVADGEEMILRSPYTRPADVYQVHYTRPADVHQVHYTRPADVYQVHYTRPADAYQVYYVPTAPTRQMYTIDTTSVARTAPIVPATYVRPSEIPAGPPTPAVLSADAVHVIQDGAYVGYTETTVTRSVIVR